MSEEISMQEKLEEVDARIDELKGHVEMAEAVKRLEENEDFQKVIIGGYLDNEAHRLFGVLVEPSTLKRDVMENIVDKLSSIRNLKQYFGTIGQNAHMAPEQIEEEQAYRKGVTEYIASKESDDSKTK